MHIVYMGTPQFAVPTLQKLIAEGHEIDLVVTQPDRKGNRGKVIYSPVKACALVHGIDVAQPFSIKNDPEFVDLLKQINPELIVVAAFGQILPQSVLDIPIHGCINVHGSLLPEYRGAAPMQYAILDGKTETGVTIMKMEASLDTGDMISSAKTEIDRKDIVELSEELAELGANLAAEAVKQIERGQETYTKQDDSLSSYAHMISKEDGYTDFNASAVSIDNKIRAFKAWPGTYTTVGDKILKIFEAVPTKDVDDEAPYGTVIEVDRDSFVVRCADGALKIYEVQLQGKKRMPVADFIRGFSLDVGMRLGMRL
ncbi:MULTISPECIES: methionyl-tRNA formyltransferase [Mogibacterium]|jgi:methionyl-tRNA formyltransferase|uniref:methionyl-tRNA formyltransferase n=1 Tax=Mogibacterium TaxID=86331 RepID=UPI00027C5E24|nr:MULTISPECIES: methionyl-tRNA formyltransferase [Mogibacterium]EJU19247.1 methionyl-tRNA formyltransferase [Mogibacterium sp. CM50]